MSQRYPIFNYSSSTGFENFIGLLKFSNFNCIISRSVSNVSLKSSLSEDFEITDGSLNI